MTPDQLNVAATALTPPTGDLASLDPAGDDGDDSSENEEEGGATTKSGHMTSDRDHMTPSDEEDVSSDDGGHELTRAEALAALKKSKGKTVQRDGRKSLSITNDKDKGVCVCVVTQQKS